MRIIVNWEAIIACLLMALLCYFLYTPIVNLHALGGQAAQVVEAVHNHDKRIVQIERYIISKTQPTPTATMEASSAASESNTPKARNH